MDETRRYAPSRIKCPLEGGSVDCMFYYRGDMMADDMVTEITSVDECYRDCLAKKETWYK